MIGAFKLFFKDRRGATAVEYGLLVTLISIGLLSGLEVFGNGLTDVFSKIDNAYAGAQ
jgi:pilus assembly protein Flp/PilA